MNELLRKLLWLPEQASTLARSLDTLHYVIIITTMIGSFGVVLLIGGYVLKYRDDPARPREEAGEHRAPGTLLWLEIVAIGGLLILFTAFWVVGYDQFTRLQRPPEDALPIYVSGKQWMWSFAYPGGAGSVGVLYVPEDRPVKLLLTSRDVIHSFYVPAFRTKQDVVPGRMTVTWFEAPEQGRHDVLCTEYCGTDHSRMRAEVVVLSAEDFERRTRLEQDAGVAELARRGERIADEQGCGRCHRPTGASSIGPSLVGLYGSIIALASGERVRADEAYLTRAMMDPGAEVRAPYSAVMPSYQGVLDAGQVGALVEYIRSLRAQPIDSSEVSQ